VRQPAGPVPGQIKVSGVRASTATAGPRVVEQPPECLLTQAGSQPEQWSTCSALNGAANSSGGLCRGAQRCLPEVGVHRDREFPPTGRRTASGFQDP
jgi:hypothetical protein